MTDPAPVPPVERPPIVPSDWRELSPLLDAVLDAEPEQRAALIVELSAGDGERRRALEQLVADCHRNAPLLDRSATERFGDLEGESTDALLPALVDERYETGRELGRGGMARVYLARDLKHGRNVAIKVIRPELSASLGHDRFLRETEIAARLRHPNIVPLYDSGEVGGALYFVMPYEEGPSLRERLTSSGALPITEALSVLRDIARALAYAHEHGVVHRDVKPDNVMLSGGAAVVTDFGIAKALSVALTEGAGPTITQSGSAIGTPAYMAPEQAVGDPSTDHRADIYAFGCVAHELVVGKPPFHGMPTHEVISGHVGTVPPLVTTFRADVPSSLAHLIARCLEKNPSARPQQARELLGVLDRVASDAPATRPSRMTRLRVLRWAGGVAATAAIAVAAVVGVRTLRSQAITIAVLPFNNIAADSAIDLIAGGLAEEVASALARVPGIAIKSRTGARAYGGRLTVPVEDVARRLKADYVMTGSIRHDDERDQWILSAVLEHGVDAASVWDSSFAVGPTEQIGAVDAVVASLVAELRRRFPQVGSTTAKRTTSNPRAYRLNVAGQELLARRGQTVRESAEMFRRAIREDSLYAQAYSGLAMALSLFPYFQRVPAKDVTAELGMAARRAIALDPNLAQAHVALGVSYWFDYEWDRAEAEFKRAIQIDGRDVEARIQYARHLRFREDERGAMRELFVARAQDPGSAVVQSHLSYSYYRQHEMDSALVISARALKADSTNVTALGYRALILLAANQRDSALIYATRSVRPMASSNYVAARIDGAAARKRLSELEAERPPRWMNHTTRANIYLGLADTAGALSALEAATDARELWPNSAFDPIFEPLRKSARYNALLARVKLR